MCLSVSSGTRCGILTFSRLFDLLSSRNDFCSGLGGPRCGVSSRSAATRSSAARGMIVIFSLSLSELRLPLTLLTGVGDAGFAPLLDMPLGAETWLAVAAPSRPLAAGAEVGAALGPEAAFCFDDLNRNDMSGVWRRMRVRSGRLLDQATGDRSVSRCVGHQRAQVYCTRRACASR